MAMDATPITFLMPVFTERILPSMTRVGSTKPWRPKRPETLIQIS
jgi:hypothetical protein